MNKEMAEIIRVMSRTHARDISLHDPAFLAKSIERRLAATGITTAAAYGGHLSENSTEAEALSRALNINYSEFFRNPLTFTLLEQVILPGLALAGCGKRVLEGQKRPKTTHARTWNQ